VLPHGQLVSLRIGNACPSFAAVATPTTSKCQNSNVFALQPTHPGTRVSSRYTRICRFHSSSGKSEHLLRVLTQS
jgi:hypothetical protein